MASDAVSFFRIGSDGLTAEMRRSGSAWKNLVAALGESVCYRLAVARTVAQHCMLDGILDIITHERAAFLS